FTPTENLINGKEYGQNWYPPNHFRPLVNWELPDEELFETYLLGPMVQMTALMMHEKRAHLAIMNAIGELCAQFSRGIVAEIRQMGVEKAIATVEKYHKELPGTEQNWYPQALEKIQSPEGQALYVNGAHNGKVGLITISRESYNWDVDQELNRVIDWLKQEGIERVILTGDFHMSTQMVGADTQEFFSALEDKEEGFRIAYSWSKTARRLNKEFHCSVGIIVGKRCLGGMLELMSHCHYLLAREDCQIGMPEVTLPVIPGMEGCHWPFRKAKSEDWSRLLQFILEGVPLPAKETRGWLVDEAAPLNKILPLAWNLASGEEVSLKPRKLEESSLNGFPSSPPPLSKAGETREKAREAIFQTIQKSCSLTLDEALEVQARMSGDFMSSSLCQKGVLGQNYSKTVQI
ncbi:MAG: enoyl-CoA hydratase/isomerase family protein, partial [Planctomycetota bacterium]